MRVLIIDDVELIRESIQRELTELYPEIEAVQFDNAGKLLDYIKTEAFDVIISDIQMPGMDGITLAGEIQRIKPEANIIFLTAYQDYAMDALELHVSGYIQKPVTKEKLAAEFRSLRYPVSEMQKIEMPKCRIQCYGNFEVFGADGLPIHFRRSKSKEAFAYIVHRKGSICTTKEVAAVLFEDAPYDLQQMRYMQKIISSLSKDFEEAGYGDVIVRQYGGLAVDTGKVECDYYLQERNIYETGERYMAQYSWAEYL